VQTTFAIQSSGKLQKATEPFFCSFLSIFGKAAESTEQFLRIYRGSRAWGDRKGKRGGDEGTRQLFEATAHEENGRDGAAEDKREGYARVYDRVWNAEEEPGQNK
jgi:hypothetical protein